MSNEEVNRWFDALKPRPYKPYRDYRGRFASKPYMTILTGRLGWQMFDEALKNAVKDIGYDTKNIQ